MFGIVYGRELREHLMSFRFGAVFLLTQLLMVSAVLVFSAEHGTAMAEYEPVSGLVDDDGLVNLQSLPCRGGIHVRRLPSRLAFASASAERVLPDEVRMAVHGIGSIARRSDVADALARGARVDWTYAIAVLLSFAAGLLTFRSVSGERENGTLALTLANSLSRAMLLAGKYAAAMSALGLSLVVGMVLSLLVLMAQGSVSLRGDDWVQLGLVLLLALLFLSVLVLLGLVCSVAGRSSTISAVLFLGAWAVLVFVVPTVSGIVAQRLTSAPTPYEIRQRANGIDDRIPVIPGMSPDEVAGAARERMLLRERILLEYAQELEGQVRTGRHLARISPASTFLFAAEAASGGGLERYRAFLDHAVRFRQGAFEAVLAADREDEDSQHRYRPWYCGGDRFSQRSVDLGPAAEFHDRPPDPSAAMAAALPDVGLLAIQNALLFLWAFARFARQEVTVSGV